MLSAKINRKILNCELLTFIKWQRFLRLFLFFWKTSKLIIYFQDMSKRKNADAFKIISYIKVLCVINRVLLQKCNV